MRLPLRSRRPHRVGEWGRFHIFGGLAFLAWLVFFGRLYELQVAQHATYAREANLTQGALHITPAVRGEIFYSTGRPLALNEKVFTVYGVPADMAPADFPAVAQGLAGIVGSPSEEIQALFEKSPSSRYVPIASGISADIEQHALALNVKGIGSFAELRRSYPDGGSVGALSGFVGWEGRADTAADHKVGRYGIEEYNEDILAGVPGRAESQRDAQGRWIPVGENVIQESVPGADLTLTIDDTIQSVACSKFALAAKSAEAPPDIGALDVALGT